MNGDFGQKCPDCGGVMELNENRATDGREMFGLSCRTHGRHTEWYLSRASALRAPVIGKRTPHSVPIADAEAVAAEPDGDTEPRNAKELVERGLGSFEAPKRRRG